MKDKNQESGPAIALARDTRSIRPYQLRAHQIAKTPLVCLFWELRWHGFGPFELIEPRILHVMHGNYDLDFFGMRALFPELRNITPPIITTCSRCDCGHCAASE